MSRTYPMHAPLSLDLIPVNAEYSEVRKSRAEDPGYMTTKVLCDYCEARVVVLHDDGLLSRRGAIHGDGWKIVTVGGPFNFGGRKLSTHNATQDACPDCVREEGLNDEH